LLGLITTNNPKNEAMRATPDIASLIPFFTNSLMDKCPVAYNKLGFTRD
jgi:hypothetical protein